MENKTIVEFEVGEIIQGFFLIKEASSKVTSNNKDYMDFTLGDQTGEINAKLWECGKGDNEKFKQNELIKIRGLVQEWRGQKQLKINRIRLTNKNDNLNIKDFVQVAPQDEEEMYNTIIQYISNMKNEDIKNIVRTIVTKSKNKLKYYPAAKKNHHAIRSGLLFHIKTMLVIGEKLCEIYDHIDRDLLYGGIILHDICKTCEMDANDLGIVSDYTKEGKLLGHIIQGIKEIEVVAKEVNADCEAALLLQHMVLTHHYEPEFGSPKKPMIPEAELLHYIDIIDARMYDMKNVLEDVEEEGFSERIWSLDNRSLYNKKI